MEPIDDLDRRLFDQWDAYVTQNARVPSKVRKWALAGLAGATTLAVGSGVIVLRADGREPARAATDVAVMVTTTTLPRVIVIPSTRPAPPPGR